MLIYYSKKVEECQIKYHGFSKIAIVFCKFFARNMHFFDFFANFGKATGFVQEIGRIFLNVVGKY